MDTFKSFKKKIYSINEQCFSDIALEIFNFQASHNPVYNEYIRHLRINPASIARLEDIPFLPISFFKSQTIKSGNWETQAVFSSSGTTGQQTSKHEVASLDDYLINAKRSFEHFFSTVDQFHILALLPSYLERSGSSLIAMIDDFIRRSNSPYSGFYLNDLATLTYDLIRLRDDQKRVILWGVSFALLDFAEMGELDLSHCMIMETGGMKGRRREITRHELHDTLRSRFNVSRVYSEYGMTELLSQAYTTGGLKFSCPPWMKVIGRDILDPFSKGLVNENCAINVIDLANVNSISFLETEDLGKIYPDSSFEILGRMDNSDIRGCNLLI